MYCWCNANKILSFGRAQNIAYYRNLPLAWVFLSYSMQHATHLQLNNYERTSTYG